MRSRLAVLVVLAAAGSFGGCNCNSQNDSEARGPLLASLQPAQGPAAGGTVVLLTGERFDPQATVSFGGKPSPAVVVAGAQTLTAVAPAGASGPVDVLITNPDGKKAQLSAAFTYADAAATALALTQALPGQGPSIGGSLVEVHGTGFLPGALAFVGGRPARKVTVVSPELITVVIPAGPIGPADLAVSNPDGSSAQLPSGFAWFDAASAQQAAPKLSSIAPAQGSSLGGQQAIVAGTGFVPGMRAYFGGVPVGALTFDANQVALTLPPGKPGIVDVAVTNPDGQGDVLIGAFNYYTPAALIAAITPNNGPVDGGTQVTITGRNFTADAAVTLGGKPLNDFTFVDEQTLQGRTPKGATFGYVDLQVVLPGAIKDVLTNAFYYTDAEHPAPGSGAGPGTIALVRISPSTGPNTGGTIASLFGDGFQQGATVTFAGAPATDVQVLGATSLRLKVPAGKLGPATVQIKNPDRGTASLNGIFNFYDSTSTAAGPALSGAAPGLGPTTGGAPVMILGSNFDKACKVFFGTAVSAPVRWLSATQMIATLPPSSSPGPVAVTVVNPDGKSDSLMSGFAYYLRSSSQQDPQITSVTPATGPAEAETAVTLTGQRFQPGALVYAGTTPASKITVSSSSTLTATLPALPTGKVDLAVVNPDGLTGTLANGFEYEIPAPSISSLRPTRGPLTGGVTVLVLGQSFDRGAKVTFGRNPSPDVRYVDSTALQALVAPDVAGTVDVTVTNPDGQSATLSQSFVFDPDWSPLPTPTLSEVKPPRGPTTGGSAVLIEGTGFSDGISVFFADQPASSIVKIDDRKLYVVTPPNSAGPAHVTVIGGDGQTAVLAGGYTYVDPGALGPRPTLTGTSPTNGKETTTTTTLLTGSGFQSGAFVFFGGIPAANPMHLSANIYQADALAHAPGAVDVAITNADGQSAILKRGFNYIARPTLASISPASGPIAGGTSILVTGEHFQEKATVKIGGTPAGSVSVTSSTLLSCTTPSGTAGPADVVIANPDGQTFTLAAAFTFVAPPFIGSQAFIPASGPSTGGTMAVLKGQHFLDGLTVTLGGKRATAQFVDDATVAVQIPAGAVGYADLAVQNPDGQQASAARAFLYKDPTTLGPGPALSASAASPNQGPQAGGTLLVASGGNFKSGALMFLGMRPASSVLWVAADMLTGITPAAAAPGKVVLSVTNPDGQTAQVPNAFNYLAPSQLQAPPSLTNLSPQQASIFGDTVVAATGANFAQGAMFFFGGRPSASAIIGSPTGATVTAPVAPSGPASVAVTNPDGQTAYYKGSFDYVVPPPAVLTVTPGSGSTRGGTVIDIVGRNFQTGVTAQIAGGACSNLTVLSPLKIECTTPPGADGPAAVKVTNPDGQSAQLANGFAYVSPPVAVTVSPTSGPVAGGTTVSITGSSFAVGATAGIGTKACLNVNRVSSVLLTCTTPAGVAGPAAVVVTNPDGQAGTLAAGFTYLPPIPAPALTSVVPNYGSVRGGSGVTLIGSAFQVGATVKFGTVAASGVTVMSPTAISCISPALPFGKTAGAVDVTVTNPDSQSANLAASFTYVADGSLPPLAVTGISPVTGGLTGGTTVTITGNGFAPSLAVTFGSQNPCVNLARIGPTVLTCQTPPAPGGAGGYVNVTVTNPDGQQIVVSNGFKYDQGGRFVAAGQNLSLESSSNKHSLVLADFDRNGAIDYLELYDGRNNNTAARLEMNDGTGKLTPANGNWPTEPTIYSGTGTVPIYNQAQAVDVNKDLNRDVLVLGDNMLVVYKNDGTGKFTRSAYPTCPDASSGYRDGGNKAFTVADFNGDGFPDVAIARTTTTYGCYDAVTKTWSSPGGELLMLNDGTGKFTFRNNIPSPNDDSRAIAAGDFDRDGDIDLIVANDSNHQNRLYLNDGTGKFVDVSPGATSTPLFPVSAGNCNAVAVADIDKDGDLDIVMGNNGRRMNVFVNDGTGRFTDVTLTNRVPADADTTYELQFADIDNDGDLDIVTRKSGGLQMRIYRNDGAGFFSADAAASMLPPDLGEALYDVGIADLNRDGYLDLALMQESYQSRILLSDTLGHFVRRTISVLPEENAENFDAVAVDVDGDGDKDLVVCGEGPMQPRLWLNDGAGNFVDYTAQRMPAIKLNCEDVDAVDVNGDGAMDLVFANTSDPGTTSSGASGAGVYLFLNNGAGTFIESTYPRLPSDSLNRGMQTFTIEPIDFDKDGDMDLLVGNGCSSESRGTLRLWQNLGKNTGYFVDVTGNAGLGMGGSPYCDWSNNSATGVKTYYPVYNMATDIQVGDLDNDGWPDIFITRGGSSSRSGSSNMIFLNRAGISGNIFSDVTSTKMANPISGRRAALVDFDGSGTLDVYVANWDDDRLYLNTGGGLLSDVTPSTLPRRDSSLSVVVTDVDKNGTPDVVLSKSGRAMPLLLLNMGAARFQDFTSSKMPWTNDDNRSFVKGDFNGDGDADILMLNKGQARMFLHQP